MCCVQAPTPCEQCNYILQTCIRNPGNGQRHLIAGVALTSIRGRADDNPLFILADAWIGGQSCFMPRAHKIKNKWTNNFPNKIFLKIEGVKPWPSLIPSSLCQNEWIAQVGSMTDYTNGQYSLTYKPYLLTQNISGKIFSLNSYNWISSGIQLLNFLT